MFDSVEELVEENDCQPLDEEMQQGDMDESTPTYVFPITGC
jgi:hypothetical protein